MPSQLHLEEEFTAKENVHANICKKPPSVSEGATSNNVTVQASNLSSEKESKEEKQTTRMGPLTFDVNPKLKEDKHVYLASVNNQAKLMRWHYCLGHLAFSKLKQLVLNGEIPQQLGKVKPPACTGCLFGAMTKAPWRGRETPQKKCQSNDFDANGLHCPAEGNTHQETLHSGHHLCRPLFDQMSLQTLCQAARRPHPPLPLQQRTIFRQRLQKQLQCKGAATHLLWGQHPLPKWHCRESHQGPLGEFPEAAPPCAPTMAGRHPLGPLAICPHEGHTPPQYFTCFGGWYLKARAF
jgi:hypothetical protein